MSLCSQKLLASRLFSLSSCSSMMDGVGAAWARDAARGRRTWMGWENGAHLWNKAWNSRDAVASISLSWSLDEHTGMLGWKMLFPS